MGDVTCVLWNFDKCMELLPRALHVHRKHYKYSLYYIHNSSRRCRIMASGTCVQDDCTSSPLATLSFVFLTVIVRFLGICYVSNITDARKSPTRAFGHVEDSGKTIRIAVKELN